MNQRINIMKKSTDTKLICMALVVGRSNKAIHLKNIYPAFPFPSKISLFKEPIRLQDQLPRPAGKKLAIFLDSLYEFLRSSLVAKQNVMKIDHLVVSMLCEQERES